MEWALEQFSRGRAEAQKRFRVFVSEGKGARYAPWEELFGQIYLGGESFRKKMHKLVSEKTRSPEIPREQRETIRPEMSSILAAVAAEYGIDATVLGRKSGKAAVSEGRRLVAYLARTQAARSLAEIGSALGVTHWGASKLASAAQTLLGSDRRFGRRARVLESRLREKR